MLVSARSLGRSITWRALILSTVIVVITTMITEIKVTHADNKWSARLNKDIIVSTDHCSGTRASRTLCTTHHNALLAQICNVLVWIHLLDLRAPLRSSDLTQGLLSRTTDL